MVTALVCAVAGTVFVVARHAVAAGGRASAFVVAGSRYVDAARTVPGLIVHPGGGYDGQFYFRLALDPADLARRAFGITFDTGARRGRIGYPALSWLLSFGHHALVPDSLIVVNVVGFALLGLAAGLMARASGRHALWGLTVAGYWGFLWTMGRDLTEVTAAAFLLLGLYAYRRQAWVAAGAGLLASLLCNESSAYVPVVIAAVQVAPRLVPAVRRWAPPAPLRATSAWIVPLAGYGAWQVTVLALTGSMPVLDSGSSNSGLPFVGPVRGLVHYLGRLPSTASLLWLGEAGLLALFTVLAALAVRRSAAPLHERGMWVVAAVLTVCAASGIWLGDVGFRSLYLVYVLDWLVLLGTRWRLRWPALAVPAAWLVVCVELVRFI